MLLNHPGSNSLHTYSNSPETTPAQWSYSSAKRGSGSPFAAAASSSPWCGDLQSSANGTRGVWETGNGHPHHRCCHFPHNGSSNDTASEPKGHSEHSKRSVDQIRSVSVGGSLIQNLLRQRLDPSWMRLSWLWLEAACARRARHLEILEENAATKTLPTPHLHQQSLLHELLAAKKLGSRRKLWVIGPNQLVRGVTNILLIQVCGSVRNQNGQPIVLQSCEIPKNRSNNCMLENGRKWSKIVKIFSETRSIQI